MQYRRRFNAFLSTRLAAQVSRVMCGQKVDVLIKNRFNLLRINIKRAAKN
jgi:hypothetical protein